MTTITHSEERELLITDSDRERLWDVIDFELRTTGASSAHIKNLRDELEHARAVQPHEVPPDLVTMNSTIELRDLDTDELETYSLVFPEDMDMRNNRLSVLTPLGVELLGSRVGDEIRVRGGSSQVRVENILHQPERSGEPQPRQT